MSGIDPNYLKHDQYKDSSRLSARARLHSQYSRNPYGWFKWLFDQFQFPPEARLLELGAGAGWLWLNNADRIPEGWQITLSDFSAGMVNEQRQALAVIPHGFTFEEIDIQAIPYDDATFDGLIANHMLYHVPDRAQAIAELRRVLKPGGRLYTATNGEKHMRELHLLMELLGFDPSEWLGGFVDRGSYSLESAPDQLRAQFDQVEIRRYDDAIEAADPEAVVDYIRSHPLQLSDEQVNALRAFIQARISKTGNMVITKDSGVVIAQG